MIPDSRTRIKKLQLKKNIGLYFLLTLMLFNINLNAQERKVLWKSDQAAELDLSLFHSTDVVNLPTAETLQKGDFNFEISHRFNTAISEGISELYGFDGSVTMRIALGYALSDNLLFTLGRSNRNGNIDFRLKYKAFQIRNETFPTLISFRAGGAYNGKARNVDSGDKYQFYGQLIINTLYDKKIGIGLVPSFLYNSHIYCIEKQDTFTFGIYTQYYVSDRWNVFIEFNPTVTGWRDQHNSMAFGVELETGGHFFKILLGNNTRLNPSQYLAGSLSDDWHIGFNITRLLKF